jgi:hypothetical protein
MTYYCHHVKNLVNFLPLGKGPLRGSPRRLLLDHESEDTFVEFLVLGLHLLID